MSPRQLTCLCLLLPALAVVWAASARGVELHPLAAMATAGVVALLAVLLLGRGVRWQPSHSCLLALAAWCGVLAGLRPVSTRAGLAVVATTVVALGLALIASTPRGMPAAHLAVVVSALVAAGWLTVERLTNASRPSGPFGNTNISATVVLLGLAVVPALRAPTWVSWSFAGACIAGVVASGSRAVLLGALAVAALWLLLRPLPRVLRWLAGALALAAIIGLGARIVADRDPLRFERFRLWGVAVRTCLAELPLGTGPSGYADAAAQHNFARVGEFAHYARIPSLAESDLLGLTASLGLPGLVIAMVLVGQLGRRVRRARPEALAVAAAVLATSAVHSQLGVPILAWNTALALAATWPRVPGRRVRMPAQNTALPLLVLAFAALVMLAPPRQWLGGSPVELLDNTKAGLRSSPDDDAALADAQISAWRAATLRPRAGGAWNALGRVRFHRAQIRNDVGLAALAVDAFRQARAVNPKDAFSALGEAEALRWLNHPVGARNALGDALRLEPNMAPAWFLRSLLCLEAGDLGGAKAAFARGERIIESAPRSRFVSAYEYTLASASPELRARLASVLRGPP